MAQVVAQAQRRNRNVAALLRVCFAVTYAINRILFENNMPLLCVKVWRPFRDVCLSAHAITNAWVCLQVMSTRIMREQLRQSMMANTAGQHEAMSGKWDADGDGKLDMKEIRDACDGEGQRMSQEVGAVQSTMSPNFLRDAVDVANGEFREWPAEGPGPASLAPFHTGSCHSPPSNAGPFAESCPRG